MRINLNQVLVMLIILFVNQSCSDDNSTYIEEKEETRSNGAEIMVYGRSIRDDAFAEYCNENGKEFLSISNNPIHLGKINFEWDDLEIGDYLYVQVSDPDLGSFNYFAVIYDESVTGIPDMIEKITDFDTQFELSSLSSDNILGTFSGNLLASDSLGGFQLIPYSVDFNAEILGVAAYCD